MQPSNVIVLTNGMLNSPFAKTCHGLLRGSDRFRTIAVIDDQFAGQDAGEVMDGKYLDIPIFERVEAFFRAGLEKPKYLVVGVALPGGILPDTFQAAILTAIQNGLSIVCGLHKFLSEDPVFAEAAKKAGVSLIDVRKARPRQELQFWTGEIYTVKAPIIAVLGIDCAVGKRTTCRFLMEMCRENGIPTEMIYTGQTGWMQGYPHGFIFDSTVNDFIGGEMERAIVNCYKASKPELILLEGQSALRNPTGPCGAEFLLSGNAKAVVLQYTPGRAHYEDTKVPLPSLESEIALIGAYGAKVLAITLNDEALSESEWRQHQRDIQEKTGLPCIHPLVEGVEGLLPLIRTYIATFDEPHSPCPS